MKYNTALFSICLFFLSPFISFSQIPYVNNSCYCIEESNAPPNILYQYRVAQQDWVRSGAVSYGGVIPIIAERIEAIALNPVDSIIYVFDGAKFGTIKIGTNKFNLINSSLSGSGKIRGNVINNFSFGDIDGLTYNLYTKELWATNRMNGNGVNDLLFKINPETGTVIKGVFGGYDFVEIEESFDSAIGGSVYNVDDIAVNPFTNKIFAIQNQNAPGIITIINKIDGSIEQEIFDLNGENIEGLGFSGYGCLLGSTGDDSDAPSSIIKIDFINFDINELGIIDESLPDGIGDFESFDCVSDYVDLALDAKTNSQNVFNIGDIAEIDITVYNQGTIEIDKLEITMHLPAGLTLISNGWINEGVQTHKKSISSTNLPLNSGLSYTFPVQIKLDNPVLSNYSISFEISKVQNNIINLVQGYLIDLPDVDSTPDAVNNELNIINNEINQNGKFFNEDEDDHDIATIKFLSNTEDCPVDLIIPTINNTIYNAGSRIYTTGIVDINYSVEMYAGHEIIFGNNFSVVPGGSLIAEIRFCN